MKLRYFILFSALFAMQSCSSSTASDPSQFDFTVPNAAHINNVSGITGVTTLYSTKWNGVDIEWKDSTGKLDSLSSFPGKVILLSFWNTAPDSSFADEPTLDSVQTDMGDSVVIVSVASYNSTKNYLSIDTFVQARHFRHQIVVDSTQRAQVRYAGNNQLGYPETFVLKPNGNVMDNNFFWGWASRPMLDSLVRLAYH